MKYIKLLIVTSFFISGIWFQSCYDDKGNYSYAWIPQEEVVIQIADTNIGRGDTLRLPITIINRFFDETGYTEIKLDTIEDYSNYSYAWFVIRNGDVFRHKDTLSKEWNFNKPVFLPITNTGHRLILEITNKETNIVSLSGYVNVTVSGTYQSAFLFLTEDDDRNVEMEIYATTKTGENVLEKNVLENAGFPYTTDGANCILYDGHRKNCIYIATGSGISWLKPNDFSYDELTHNISSIMMPPAHTFSVMKRGGINSKSNAQYTGLCFITPDGEVHTMTKRNPLRINPNSAIVDRKYVKVAQMAATDLNTALLWDETNSQFVYFPVGGMMGPDSKCIAFTGEGQVPANSSCVYIGNSRSINKNLIGVVKYNDGEFWKYEYKTTDGMDGGSWCGDAEIKRKIKLNGTGNLGNIEHYVSILKEGDLYCSVGNKLYTYREQVQNPELGAWKEVEIYDPKGNLLSVNLDPITLLHSEDFSHRGSSSHWLYNAFYVLTYSLEKGGTLYILEPDQSGENTKIILLDKIEGIGNVKSMSYWGYL